MEMKDPLRDLPGYALRRASARTMADFAQRLAPLGIRSTEAAVLMLIAANPGVTQSLLGKALAVKRANMAPLIARLEERGLLARAAVDGRSQGLALTAAGHATHLGVSAVVKAHEDAILALIPPALRGAMLDVLHALF
jgi:DNA-binding MarR family transcriptional regulator